VVVHDEGLPSDAVVDIDRDGRIRGFELFEGSKSPPLNLLDELASPQSIERSRQVRPLQVSVASCGISLSQLAA
jgi:uncharacterized protein YuzE